MQHNSTIKPTRALETSAKARNGVSLNCVNEPMKSKNANNTVRQQIETQQNCKKLQISRKTWSFDDSLALILNDNSNTYVMSQINSDQ